MRDFRLPIRNSQSEIRSLIVQPEISRRCLACGGSFREGALFCPECGKPLTNAADGTSDPKVSDDAPTSALTSVPSEPASHAIASASQSPVIPAPEMQTVSEVPTPPAEDSAPERTKQTPPDSRTGKHETARDKLHRASTATREALADNVKRVEKIRQVSTVMFEEASYDPSLRFVLVALGLFIVFIVLLVLSKVMG